LLGTFNPFTTRSADRFSRNPPAEVVRLRLIGDLRVEQAAPRSARAVMP